MAATAALEVQMLVCVSLRHTCYSCTKALKDFWRTSEGLLRDFWRTSEGLVKDFWGTSEGLLKEGLLKDFLRTFNFRFYGLPNLLVYKLQPPGLPDLFSVDYSYPNSIKSLAHSASSFSFWVEHSEELWRQVQTNVTIGWFSIGFLWLNIHHQKQKQLFLENVLK